MAEKLTDPREVVLHEGEVPIRHRYTPGVAGDAFGRALKDRGELLGSTCSSCGIVYCPARLFCERCFDELQPDAACGPEGTVESFTVGYVGVEGEPLDEPIVLGLIRPDGADTVIMHRLLEVEELGIGDRVKVVLAAKRELSGSILDIKGFRLVEE
jgi:uncharacterized protein